MTQESKPRNDRPSGRGSRHYLVSGPGLSDRDIRPGKKDPLPPVEYADIVTNHELPTFG